MSEVKIKDVPHSVKFFNDLAILGVDAIAAIKSKSVWDIIKLVPEVEAVVSDAKGALPELEHLSQADAMAVGAAAFDCVKRILAVV